MIQNNIKYSEKKFYMAGISCMFGRSAFERSLSKLLHIRLLQIRSSTSGRFFRVIRALSFFQATPLWPNVP